MSVLGKDLFDFQRSHTNTKVEFGASGYGYLFSVVIANAVGLVVDVIATAQAAVKSGCAEGDFLD